MSNLCIREQVVGIQQKAGPAPFVESGKVSWRCRHDSYFWGREAGVSLSSEMLLLIEGVLVAA